MHNGRMNPLAALGRLLTLLLLTAASGLATGEEPLPPDQVFKFTARAADADTVEIEWNLPEGYYLYHEKFRFSTDTPGIELGTPQIPRGKKKQDPFFGEQEIHRGRIHVRIPLRRSPGAGNELSLRVTVQGCADLGICYPPYHKTVYLTLPPAAVAAPPAASTAPSAAAGLKALGGSLGLAGEEDEFLDPAQAFRFSAEARDAATVLASWVIADGYYLYRDKFRIRLAEAPEGVTIAGVDFPPGEMKDDEFFGRIEVFHHAVDATVRLSRAAPGARVVLEARYQGCAEAGLCYPPQTARAELTLPAGGAGVSGSSASSGAPAGTTTETPPASPAAAAAGPVSEQDRLAALLRGGNLPVILSVFFLAGLALAFTPCVFPMIPILSGIIAGQGERITTARAFWLSLVYVLAVAVTYTIAGVIAGMTGYNVQAALQNPWVLGVFAAVFVALALSMFGFYELQMPSAVQSRLSEISSRQRGGTVAGVVVMGFLSALIVGPCVAAPLAGALIFIANTGDPVIGGLALFTLSLGMGVPLIVIGTGGGKLLPKAGPWMDAVKATFGVLLLGVAVWLLERVLPGAVVMVLWALLFILPAIYLRPLDPLPPEATGWQRFWKGLGVALLAWGILLLVGAAGGSTNPLEPLAGFRGAAMPGGAAPQAHGLAFKRVKGLAGLEAELAAARAAGRPVMLDLYADWCISCKELEKYTFSDPRVAEALAGVTLLQADVTANDEQDKALLKRYGLIGPPTILFFDAQGNELTGYRVVGFMDAEEFRDHALRALGRL